ncbi:PD-(D/E)XK nuclease domain-containing protein [Blautia sp. HCP3S3_B11]|uniref:PD-(D/E)XK nuclease domain-containing protein n=1 Tax=Blautia sp. HCP3S3_B11 TaxID=3438909 RepID=UPI003F8BCDC9
MIKVKYSPTFQGLEKACQKAMKQIKDRSYEEFLQNDGRNEILAYGIAFCRKRCKVIMEKM